MTKKIADVNEIIRFWIKQKDISEKRLLNLIYGESVPTNISSNKKQIKRIINRIQIKGNYLVESLLVNGKYRYGISKKSKINTIIQNIDQVKSFIKKGKKESVFQILEYIGKDENLKKYNLVYPVEIVENKKNNKLSFFWAIILKTRELNDDQTNPGNKDLNILADEEIKRFYFSRIKGINVVKKEKQIESFIKSIDEKFSDIINAKDLKSMVDDFGYLEQNNYKIKSFNLNSDSYFKSILETQNESLYDSIRSKENITKTKGVIKNKFIWNITIEYVDIQRIAKLLLPYLNHVVVNDDENKKELIKFIDEELKRFKNRSVKSL